jgi:hypothetical protein
MVRVVIGWINRYHEVALKGSWRKWSGWALAYATLAAAMAAGADDWGLLQIAGVSGWALCALFSVVYAIWAARATNARDVPSRS